MDLMQYQNSPISVVTFNDVEVHVKRDDLLHTDFSGNKARKFYHFLKEDFKEYDKIISFGSAQANSLYSLSVLAKLKGVKLDFYVKHIASYLKDNPDGNYLEALRNGANIIELPCDDIQHKIEEKILPNDNRAVFIEEGGRVLEAQEGLKVLADELIEYTKDINQPIKLFLPSGTGTTALFLQKFLPFEVLTTPCVGDANYLSSQFIKLNANTSEHPTILEPPKKYHFGKLYEDLYTMYNTLIKTTGIEFDLLYDALGWKVFTSSQVFKKDNFLIYLHQGGLLGNKTMKLRYERNNNLTK